MSQAPRFFRVKNFEKFQHYKDRNPPWIKLYQSVMDDDDFVQLDDASKGHLMLIWLLASRTQNRVRLDPGAVRRHIKANQRVLIDKLLDKGFLIEINKDGSDIASGPLASCKQNACLETETETEKEKKSSSGDKNLPQNSPSEIKKQQPKTPASGVSIEGQESPVGSSHPPSPDSNSDPKPKRSKPTGPHAEAIDFFCSLYEQTFGIKYRFVGGRDGKIMADLLKHFGLDMLKKITRDFLTGDDPYLAGKGRTIPLLASWANTGALRAIPKASPIPPAQQRNLIRDDDLQILEKGERS